MSLPVIKYCPSTLAKGFDSYSPSALRKLFNGRKVSHILPFDSPQLNEDVAEKFRENRKHLSISGVQIKQSLRLNKNELVITEEDEQGQYILKPIPHREIIGKVDQLPSNEHLTMQIANQVYGINTAFNGLIFFKNGESAYITKRFDVNPDGKRIAQEDFATLLERSRASHGEAFKTEGSYQQIAKIMKRYTVAYPVEIENFFSLVIFNYLFCNGDAHLKNFSVQMTYDGDYILSPAYDLINTRIHIKDDTAMALSEGLFSDGYESESYRANGYYAYDDFYEFGLKIGMVTTRVIRVLNHFRKPQELVKILIARSFLDNKSKDLYFDYYKDRLKALNYSFSDKI